MAKSYSLTGYYKENEELWLWDDVPELEIEIGYKVDQLLHYEKSSFQEISIVETKGFGRMLVLDGTPQVTTKDGFIYNEMITHIPLTTHINPNKIAIIGGGDCGPARESLKYKSVQQIDVVEIDPRVVEVCRTWLSGNAVVEQNQRMNMIYRDGAEWIPEQHRLYDVLLVDRSDPYGPAMNLYKPQFYQHVFNAITDDGIAVFQSGSPFYYSHVLRETVLHLRTFFPIVRTYLAVIPSFPGGIWSFTLASKKWDPLKADLNRLPSRETKYINPETFRAAFDIPNYVKELLL